MSLLSQASLLLGILTILEACLGLAWGWRLRIKIVAVSVLTQAFATSLLIAGHPSIYTVLIGFIGVYRIFNLLRIPEARMHESYLKSSYRNTFWRLVLLQGLVAASALTFPKLHSQSFWLGLGTVQLTACFGIVIFTVYNALRYRPRLATTNYSDQELPTITVAVPARNETQDLSDCLELLIANNYPKLEILALDDCSQDKTPEVIKSFAHDGVRFVRGDVPSEHWLAKNLANQKLFTESSGSFIVFCGVDTRFDSDALRKLISIMLERKLDMVSIMPQRAKVDPLAQLIQPMRYWWEVALPRKWFKQPPSLSTCWVIKREALQKLGGFEGASRAIHPQAVFARELKKTHSYAFMTAGNRVGIETLKKPAEQFATTIRTRYPEAHKRPERVLLVTLLEISLFILPFVEVIIALTRHDAKLLVISLTCLMLLGVVNTIVITISSPRRWWLGIFNLPFALLLEMFVLNESMRRYEFGVVDWKDRNVCIPIMHTYPRLPKL